MIKEAFPRFSNSNSEVATWHRLVCQYCTLDEFREAFDKARLSSDSMPGMHSMRAHIQAVKSEAYSKGKALPPTVNRAEYKPPTEMEFCLQHLGAAYVNKRLAGIVTTPPKGKNAGSALFALFKDREWIPKYKALMEILVGEAMNVATGKSRRVS